MDLGHVVGVMCAMRCKDGKVIGPAAVLSRVLVLASVRRSPSPLKRNLEWTP